MSTIQIVNELTAADQALYAAAVDARSHAYAPYSKFQVGAALRTDDGHIHLGCNIENAAYGSTMCAERVALFGAVAAQGRPNIDTLVIVADYAEPVPPCGSCRQVIAELAQEATIILANLAQDVQVCTIHDLLPGIFELPG